MEKKKRTKKRKFGFVKILLTILILAVFGYLYFARGPKVNISYESDFLLGQPVEMTVETYRNFKSFTPETLTISVSNRYNQDASFTTELTAYDEGEYQLLITPEYAGEYTVTAKFVDGDMQKTVKDTFLIK